jgi:EF-hand domain-containing protein 1
MKDNVLTANAQASERAQTARSAATNATTKPWERDDSKTYVFYAYYQETVPESREETNRYRCFAIRCYIFDTTLQVTEVKQNNSGIAQGDFIKRSKVAKSSSKSNSVFSSTASSIMGGPASAGFYSVDDFIVGSTINLYGRQFQINGCDDNTRKYLSQKGQVVAPNVDFPKEVKDNMAMGQGVHNWKQTFEQSGGSFATKDSHIKRYVEASRGREDRVHPDAPGGLRRFLTQGDRVLRYSLLWKDNRCGGSAQVLCLNVYLKDNTMEMLYPHGSNDGRGAFKALMKRGRFPKPELVERGAMAWRGFSDEGKLKLYCFVKYFVVVGVVGAASWCC